MGKTYKDSNDKKNSKPSIENRCMECIRVSKATGKVFNCRECDVKRQ